jgi:DNA-binding transcriptional MerR regulator
VEEISIGEFARRSRLSLKALRLYDERGVLVPARVDQASGYRYYDTAQLDEARLVVMMRELQLPLAAVRELLACDPAEAATRIAEHWRAVETAHDARRDLADYLVSRLRGKRTVMYDVGLREMPDRSVLYLKRRVELEAQFAFGKEFIAILRDGRRRRGERPRQRIEGREGAVFCVYWSHPSPDGDGLIEWCSPVPAAEADTLAEHYPELTLRTEPAHLEAFVGLPADYGAAQWGLACESLDTWMQEQATQHEGDRLILSPEDLGLRTTYLANAPKDVSIDLAIPFAVER